MEEALLKASVDLLRRFGRKLASETLAHHLYAELLKSKRRANSRRDHTVWAGLFIHTVIVP